MKKIIIGRKYDTDTAELVCSNSFSGDGNVYVNGRMVRLYKTKKRNYFFAHLTLWDGEKDTIEPCLQSAAEAFAMQHLDADEFEKFFGKVEEA